MTPLPRSQDEIAKRAKERQDQDMFGFEWHEYIFYLDEKHVRPFLKSDVDPKTWETKAPDKDALMKEMHNYMKFAWEKANHCRGISANRSIMHYIAWTWLVGDDKISQILDRSFETGYEFYGKPLLRWLCEQYGWDWKSLDDGQWRNDEFSLGAGPPESVDRWICE